MKARDLNDFLDGAIRSVDPEIADAVRLEEDRQNQKIELIASENFASTAVRAAQATVLTNKYAEGYPGKRYYGGCEYVDIVENLARDRVKELFGAEHANVQPHSGSQANMGVYTAVLNPGDTIMGMDLSHGGHLTHGSPVNFSGITYNVVSYGVNRETERIDFDQVRELALKHKPKIIVAGASAYPRILDFAQFREIADEIGAYLMVDMAHIAGLVAAGVHPNPVEYAQFVTSTTHKTLRGPRGGVILTTNEFARTIDKAIFPGIQGGPLMHVIASKAIAFREALSKEFKEYQEKIVKNAKALAEAMLERGFRLVSGGTDNHLILVDLTSRDITGKEAEQLLDSIGITVNKNTIPFETRSPFITSGIRLGTPAVTTKGLGSAEMKEIAIILDKVLVREPGEETLVRAGEAIADLCKMYC